MERKKKKKKPHTTLYASGHIYGEKKIFPWICPQIFLKVQVEISKLAPKENNALWVWVWDWVWLVFRQLLNRCQKKRPVWNKGCFCLRESHNQVRNVQRCLWRKQTNKPTFLLLGVWKGAESVFSHCPSTFSHRCFWKWGDQITKPFSASQLLSWVFNL